MIFLFFKLRSNNISGGGDDRVAIWIHNAKFYKERITEVQDFIPRKTPSWDFRTLPLSWNPLTQPTIKSAPLWKKISQDQHKSIRCGPDLILNLSFVSGEALCLQQPEALVKIVPTKERELKLCSYKGVVDRWAWLCWEIFEVVCGSIIYVSNSWSNAL